MDMIAVFNVFDKYIPYDNHIIEDYTFYLVEFLNCDMEVKIFVGQKIANIHGYVLKQCELEYKIIMYLRPSSLIESNSKGKINELYDSNLNEKHKKNIINVAIGKCSRTHNSKNISKIYLNESEAYYYANKYGGTVHCVSSSCFSDVTYEDEPFIEKLFDNTVIAQYQRRKLYLLVCENKFKLEETLLPIKYFIYGYQRLKNLKLCRMLKKNGLVPCSIKTDSVLTTATEKQLKQFFKFDNKLGGIKIEKNKKTCFIEHEFKNNTIIDNNKIPINLILINTEDNFFNDIESYNNEIKQILMNNQYIVIWGKFPGTGKSYACGLISKKTLFVTPYNEKCQELILEGHIAITLHSLMALNTTGSSSSRKQFDV